MKLYIVILEASLILESFLDDTSQGFMAHVVSDSKNHRKQGHWKWGTSGLLEKVGAVAIPLGVGLTVLREGRGGGVDGYFSYGKLTRE